MHKQSQARGEGNRYAFFNIEDERATDKMKWWQKVGLMMVMMMMMTMMMMMMMMMMVMLMVKRWQMVLYFHLIEETVAN